MACKFEFNPQKIERDLACVMAEAVGYDLTRIRYDGERIAITSPDEDDFCDLEAFCVARGIAFERVTACPSQMGQEPHKATFQPGNGLTIASL